MRMTRMFFLVASAMALGLLFVLPDDIPVQEKTKEENRDTRPAVNPLHAAVRVNGSNASCGTIIKLEDEGKGCNAYVLTTGHLQKRMEMKVEVFYKNSKKLDNAEEATGELICLAKIIK